MQIKNLHVIPQVMMAVLLAGSLLAAEGSGCAQAYNRATDLLSKGKVEQAVMSYNGVVAKCPDFYPAYMMLGLAYQSLGNFEKAENYLRQAVTLSPESADPRLNLGLYYLSRGNTSKAAVEFKKAIAIDPEGPAGWFDLGLGDLRAGNAAGALTNLKKANQLDPGNLRIQLALVDAALKAKQPDLAQQQADELIAHDPKDPRLMLALGALLEENGDAARARQVFRKAKEVSPDPLKVFLEAADQATEQGRYHSGLVMLEIVSDVGRDSASWNESIGDIYYKLGQIKAAADHLQEAIRLEPLNEDYYLEFGSLLTQYHANDACLVVFQSAARVLPNSVKIQSALAVAYLMKKRYSKAEAILQSVIRTSPGYLPAYQLLGESYGAAREWEKLKKTGQTIVARDSRDAVGWYYQAQADYELAMSDSGKLSIAESEVRKSLTLRSQYGPAYYLLGKILAGENRGDEAVVALRKAASLDDDPTIFYTLALTFRKLGRASESTAALKDFNEAVARKKAAYRKLTVKISDTRVPDANK